VEQREEKSTRDKRDRTEAGKNKPGFDGFVSNQFRIVPGLIGDLKRHKDGRNHEGVSKRHFTSRQKVLSLSALGTMGSIGWETLA
jgi:hypothetical protein